MSKQKKKKGAPSLPYRLTRYPKVYVAVSPLDPFDDILVLLTSLTSEAYLTDALERNHGLTKADATRRSTKIIPHIEIATAYVRQALQSPPEISFLPAYYAILNLAKVYVLLGPKHSDLPNHRWHGATYDVAAKDSHTILTEQICIRRGGAIPLFYETLTGHSITADVPIRIREILPYIRTIEAEYGICTGTRSRLARVDVRLVSRGSSALPEVRVHTPDSSVNLSKIKLLRTFRKVTMQPLTFRGKPVHALPQDMDKQLRAQFNTHLVYHHGDAYVITPYDTGKLLLPEELPIMLLFFHLSSVVRYKPEFLDKVRRSRHWPILAAARQHSLLRILVLFWSFVHQQDLLLRHGTP